jgi:tRNA (Thr-GGU) A37 N-methylase
MDTSANFAFSPIGYVRSSLKQRKGAPRQAWEGAPSAKLEIDPAVLEGLEGLRDGQEIWILTFLHEGCSRRAPRTAPTRSALDRRKRLD